MPTGFRANARPNAYDFHGDARYLAHGAEDDAMMDAEMPDPTQVGVRRAANPQHGRSLAVHVGTNVGSSECFSSPMPSVLLL